MIFELFGEIKTILQRIAVIVPGQGLSVNTDF